MLTPGFCPTLQSYGTGTVPLGLYLLYATVRCLADMSNCALLVDERSYVWSSIRQMVAIQPPALYRAVVLTHETHAYKGILHTLKPR